MAQFLQYKAGDGGSPESLFYVFIRFLVLFKYRKTEHRPNMTEKTLTGT